MKRLYNCSIALLIAGSFGLGQLQAQTCTGAYPGAGEVALAAAAWLPAVPATPWGTNAPPTAPGVGNVNCSYSGILTVPACANNYANFYMCLGNVYQVSLCGGAFFNSYISLTTTAGAVVTPATFDNDGCGTPAGLSTFSFTPTISATYRIRIRTPNPALNGNTTNLSTTMTFASTAGMTVGSPISGPGIPANATIASIVNGTTITLSAAATSTNSGVPYNLPCLVSAALCGTMQISINPVPPPPVNNDPCGAFSLNPVTTACNMVAATAGFATQSNPPVAPVCGAFSGIDVWYTATVPASGNLSVQVEHVSAANLAMAAYTAAACGGPFTLLSCNADLSNPTLLNPFLTYSGLTPGATVYIRVWPEGNATNNGTFEICAYEPVPPPNDNPCGAMPLTVGSPCAASSFTTESATPLAAVMTATVPGCGAPLPGNDVWFSFVVPPTGSVTVNGFPGSLTNMALALYRLTAGTSCAGTLTLIGCDDNSGAGGTMPSLSQGGLTPGETLYIRMWNQSTSFGTASICVIPNTPPTNDNPCSALAISATALPVNPGCLSSSFNTQNATTTGVSNPAQGWSNAPVPGCGGAANSDIWFTAVVPGNGVLQFDTDDGSLTNMAMAVYTATGACSSGNLSLTQVGCANTGSFQGNNNMPALTVSGLTAGATVYVRLWRETVATNGTFLLCARTTVSPTGTCDYVLQMTDSGGDGWNGSTVQVCIDPPGPPPNVCTSYSIVGSNGNVTISADVGAVVTLTYTAVGGFQNQISYTLGTPAGGVLYGSGTNPATGTVFALTVNSTCNVPPAPLSDCIGSQEVCNNQQLSFAPAALGFGNTQDLNGGNRGCLNGNEIRGIWVRFTAYQTGTIAFTINVNNSTDYDFAVWGPFAGAPTCPPPGPPLRCSWSGTWGPTGLNYTSVDVSENASGDKWVRWIDAIAGQSFMLYVDNWSNNGAQFDLVWDVNPANIIDCSLLPVELLSLEAISKARQVDLKWTTATEQNSAYFQIERAEEGGHFAPLGRVQAAGSSQYLREYGFVDSAPLKGVNYYRLQQVDADGTSEYSKTVSATYRWSSVALNVYPNPAGESIWAAFEMPVEGTVRWRIMDTSGRIVSEGPANVASGMNQVEIPLSRIEAGSYMLELLDGDNASLSNARFVKN